MNKVLVLILSIVICISMYGCSSSETSDNTQASDNTEESKTVDKNSEIDITGTWTQSLWFLTTKLTINSNSTFDYGDSKGIYSFSDNYLHLTPKHNNFYCTVFKTEYNYIYSTKIRLSEDTDYGLPFTPNESGFTNQTFSHAWPSESFDPHTEENYIDLSFRDDGTFTLKTGAVKGNFMDNFQTFEGTYTHKNNILTLTYNSKDHPLVVIDGIIYFITFSK